MRAACGARCLSGAIAVAAGAATFGAWLLDSSLPSRLTPGAVPMRPDAGVGFLLLGGTVLADQGALPAAWTGMRRWGGPAAAALGAATLAEIFFLSGPAPYPRMAPDTAVGLLVLAASFWFKARSDRSPAASVAAVVLSLLTVAIGATALIVTVLFGEMGWLSETSMATSTAALFLLLGLSTAAALIAGRDRSWALEHRATAAFVVGAVLVASGGLYTNGSLARVLSRDQLIERQDEKLDEAARAVSEVGRAQAGAHAYLITGDPEFRERFLAALARARSGLEALRARDPEIAAALASELEWWRSAAAARPTGPLSASRMEEASARDRELTDLVSAAQIRARTGESSLRGAYRDELDRVSRVTGAVSSLGTIAALSAFVSGLLLLNASVLKGRLGDEERLLLASAVEQSSECVLITDPEARILYVNGAFERVTGYSRSEALGRKPSLIKSGRHGSTFYEELWATLARGETWRGRLFNRRKNGEVYEEDCSIAPVRDAAGAVTNYIAVKRDVSRERELERQFLHSQRMEAVGRLAGGIAHDFNNLLSAIMGSAHMLGTSIPAGTQAAEDVAAILDAGARAAALTRQMLTFSRRQAAGSAPMDLSASVRGIQKIIGRTLGEDVRVSVSLADAPVWIDADAGQIDQVILNLAVNARDAMPGGGGLRISTSVRELSRTRVAIHDTAPAGVYAVLRCEDTGVGMNEEVQSRLFEPFFTTKDPGKGTGLGLSTVFGIVRQSGGHIFVDSSPGLGTAFEILFPLAAAPAAAGDAAACAAAQAACSGTILLVEDEEAVLRIFQRALKSRGYTVLCARNAEEALVVSAAHRGKVDLLLTDVVMPGVSGDELARRIVAGRPGTKVLYMSGYSEGRLANLDQSVRSAGLLHKPFALTELTERVRGALEGA